MTPVLNDWASLAELVQRIGALAALAQDRVVVVAVDDGSIRVEPPPASALGGALEQIHIVRLRANQGHQRAIALGLAWAERNVTCDLFVVMDSDGEDRPEELENLLAAHRRKPEAIVVARRKRRSEGLAFRVFYQVYKALFLVLTGKPISFGNFSLIPAQYVPNVIYNGGVWNNYAATLLRCRIPIVFEPTIRGTRYFGVSSMNFTSLMIHGMSAISVFSDMVIGRIIAGLAGLTVLFVGAVAVVIYVKLATTTFVLGYATNVILFLASMLVNALLLGLLTILSLLASRSQSTALPASMLQELVAEVRDIRAKPELAAE